MGDDGQRYRLREAVWTAPCGCAVQHGLLNYGYRFCPPHALATDHAPKPTNEHIRMLWRVHNTALSAFFDVTLKAAA